MKQAIIIAGPNCAGKTTFAREFLPQETATVAFHFLRLPSVELAIKRVEFRVKHGGNHIPDDVVKRRYEMGLMHLQDYQNTLNEWKIWDTSHGEPELIDES